MRKKIKEREEKRDYGAWWASRKNLERADKVAEVLSSMSEVISQEGGYLDEEVKKKLLAEHRGLMKSIRFRKKR